MRYNYTSSRGCRHNSDRDSLNLPLIQDEWVPARVHINAIGTNSPGEQELDPKTVTRAKVVVDSTQQCVQRGEIQTAIKMNLFRKEEIYSELSEIVLGRKKGRVNDTEITIFDSTGMAVQDITTAFAVYQLARKLNVGVNSSTQLVRNRTHINVKVEPQLRLLVRRPV
jgi:ornithine cyclodeaminase/alanine dehydrogenase-like protein (mu-crystallin family)